MEHKKSGKCRLVTAVLTAVMSVTAFVGGGVLLANNLTASAEDYRVEESNLGWTAGDNVVVKAYWLNEAHSQAELELTASTESATMTSWSGFSSPAWKAYSDKFTVVTIGSGITNIGVSAFAGFTSLKTVTISETVTKIEANAFSGCSNLTSIVLPAGVETIGEGAFFGCASLKNVTIGSKTLATAGSVTVDPFGGLFETDKELAKVVLPSGVTSETAWENSYANTHFDIFDENTNTYIAHKHEADDTFSYTKEATCYEEGEKVWKCTVSGCGAIVDREPVAKIAHTYSDTYTDFGDGTHGLVCTVKGCANEVSGHVQTASISEHHWVNPVTTKDEDGNIGLLYTCKECTATNFEIVALDVVPGPRIENENANFYGVGAAVKLNETAGGKTGICFAFSLSSALVETLQTLDVTVGVLMLPSHMVGEDVFNVNSQYVKNLSGDLSVLVDDGEGDYLLSASINLSSAYLDTKLTARAYIEVAGVYYYSDTVERTMTEVAQKAYVSYANETETAYQSYLVENYNLKVIEYTYNGKIKYVFVAAAGEHELTLDETGFTLPAGKEYEFVSGEETVTAITVEASGVYKVTIQEVVAAASDNGENE